MSTSRDQTPLVSVVIPAFRAECFIEETINSVRAQRYRPIEVVVVEDCSPDRTAEVVEALADRWGDGQFKIRLLRQPQNMGGAAALSRGFSEAEGKFLCWLSADDAFVGTDKLSAQVRQLEAGAADVSYGTSFYTGPSMGDDSTQLITAAWMVGHPIVDKMILRSAQARLIALLFRNPVNGSTVMISRRSWERLGNFDPALGNIDQDTDVWMRYSAQDARFTSVTFPTGFYRIHPGQTSSLKRECTIGASATRIRVIMAHERTGKLARLLVFTTPVLLIAQRRRWHVERPIVASYLCSAGLRSSRNPWVRQLLKRMQADLVTSGLPDQELASEAEKQAAEAYDSPEFALFIERLSR